MPQVTCPSCGTRRKVRVRQLGRPVFCTGCTDKYVAEANHPLARLLAAHHPAGAVLGSALLALALALATPATLVFLSRGIDAALVGDQATLTRTALVGALGAAVLGGLLVVRWRRYRRPPDAGQMRPTLSAGHR